MLRTRALVATVALPLVAVIIVSGGWLYAAVVSGILLVGGVEYVLLMRQINLRPPAWLVLATIALPVAATWFEHEDWRAPGLAALLIGTACAIIWDMEHQRPQPINNAAIAIFGGIYLGWLGAPLLALRQLDEGMYMVLLVYGLVIISDSAAYLVGSQWGRRKLSPRVSPNKSWEGYAGSVVSGIIVGALAGGLPASDVMNVGHGAILGLLIGTLGTVGDLAISALKRQVGVKDSSNLIPGHGGMLDRIDSVLVGATVGYYYVVWFVT